MNVMDVIAEIQENEDERNKLLSGYEMYEVQVGDVCKVSFIRCTNVLSRCRKFGELDEVPGLYCNDEGDEIALKLMKFYSNDTYVIKSNEHIVIDVGKKINQQIVKYLHTVKKLIEAVNITFTADNGTVKEGLATKRKNGLWRIKLSDESIHEDVDIIGKLAEKKITINYMRKKEEQSMKRINAMKERKLEEEARKIATVKGNKYCFDKYKDICSKIE
jgi:hypothetical protein